MENSDNELSSDDSDYNPEGNKEVVSEDSAEDFDDELVENSEESCSKKQKRIKKTKAKVSRSKTEPERLIENDEIDPEEEKRKADAIWAEFLGETETSKETLPSEKRPTEYSSVKASSSQNDKMSTPRTITADKTAKEPERSNSSQIFEFAGETVNIPPKLVNDNIDAPKIPAVKRSSSGLSSVLSQLTKKNKLSVLEKTKLDWDGFKSTEGINEELQTHNRGRDG